MAEAHRVSRPQWTCLVDGEDWPCAIARREILRFNADPDELSRRMLFHLASAVDDLGLSNPRTLYRRFVGWTLPEEALCRVCGKAGHDFVPGVPPQLIPCKGWVMKPLREHKRR